jgi:hypothetical protein
VGFAVVIKIIMSTSSSNEFKQLDPETDTLLIALAEAENRPDKID